MGSGIGSVMEQGPTQSLRPTGGPSGRSGRGRVGADRRRTRTTEPGVDWGCVTILESDGL